MYSEFTPPSERISTFIKKNKVVVIIGLIILIIVILFCFKGCSSSTNNRESLEKSIKIELDDYISNNNLDLSNGSSTFISFKTLNYTPKNYNCQSGGVLITLLNGSYEYEYFYECNIVSEQIAKIRNDNKKFEKDIKLKGKNPIYISNDNTYKEPGYTSNLEIEVSGEVSDKSGVYYLHYTVKSTSNRVTRIVIVEKNNSITESPKTYPTITLINSEPLELYQNSEYVFNNATANDPIDGNLDDYIEVENDINIKKPGTYTVKYSVTNSRGLTSSVSQTVVVKVSNSIPKIVLIGEQNVIIEKGTKYEEPGYTASDDIDGDLTETVEITNRVKENTPGIYTITYKVTNSGGKSATVNRIVQVK